MSRPPLKPAAILSPAAKEFHPPSVPEFSPVRERRRRPRVLLQLPVQIRWLGPFGLETEVTQTENVSRDGLLISSFNVRHPGSQLWATFPYDAAVVFTESETPGIVAWCKAESANKNVVAISFHQNDPIWPRNLTAADDSSAAIRSHERRRQGRISLAYLIRVSRIAPTRRVPHAMDQPSQPEETMTVNVSPAGMAFCTLRIYSSNERITIATPAARDLSAGKRYARVVRVAPLQPNSPLSHVAVEFLL